MTNNHANKCLLSSQCKLANTAKCTKTCEFYIGMHALSGTGGRVAAANVPADYRLVTASNMPTKDVDVTDSGNMTRKLSQYVEAYIATFSRQFDPDAERIRSLYLVSESPGTGKTTTASAILNEWLVAHYLGSLKRKLQPLQQPAYFLDVNAWQTDYNNFNRPKVPDAIAEPAAKRYYNAMERAKHAPMVVLDDIGVRDCTDSFRADLHAIINHRVTNKLATIYTSNLPIRYDEEANGKKVEAFKPYDLVDVFGEERLADRISDMCLTLSFAGESKRGMRR